MNPRQAATALATNDQFCTYIDSELKYSCANVQANVNNNMAEETNEAGVDQSHISPIERRDSLEKHLQASKYSTSRYIHPPGGILTDTSIVQKNKISKIGTFSLTPPPLQRCRPNKAELERQRITDNLRKGLEKRPEKEELVEKNILPDSTAAPALQEKQKELEKHMRADSLEKGLQNRPRPEELVKEGILNGE